MKEDLSACCVHANEVHDEAGCEIGGCPCNPTHTGNVARPGSVDRYVVHRWTGSDPDECLRCGVEWSNADSTCAPQVPTDPASAADWALADDLASRVLARDDDAFLNHRFDIAVALSDARTAKR